MLESACFVLETMLPLAHCWRDKNCFPLKWKKSALSQQQKLARGSGRGTSAEPVPDQAGVALLRLLLQQKWTKSHRPTITED